MKRMLILVPVLGLLVGCTSPAQRIAANALQRGADHEHSIVYDLANMAKQSAVDRGVAETRLAVTAGDADAAQKAVERAVSQFDKIGWLQIQHERARGLIRVGQRFIWEQQGIFDLMLKEIKTSKERADKKWENGDKQFATLTPVAHEKIDTAHGR